MNLRQMRNDFFGREIGYGFTVKNLFDQLLVLKSRKEELAIIRMMKILEENKVYSFLNNKESILSNLEKISYKIAKDELDEITKNIGGISENNDYYKSLLKYKTINNLIYLFMAECIKVHVILK